MKVILGHKSRDQGEIMEILMRQGNYTCPTLPHYRYDRVKSVCRKFQRLGLLRKTGRDQVSVNLAVTDLFREWKSEKVAGKTVLGPERWVRARIKDVEITPGAIAHGPSMMELSP